MRHNDVSRRKKLGFIICVAFVVWVVLRLAGVA